MDARGLRGWTEQRNCWQRCWQPGSDPNWYSSLGLERVPHLALDLGAVVGFAADHSSFAADHSSLVADRSSLVADRSSLVADHSLGPGNRVESVRLSNRERACHQGLAAFQNLCWLGSGKLFLNPNRVKDCFAQSWFVERHQQRESHL